MAKVDRLTILKLSLDEEVKTKPIEGLKSERR